MDTLVRETFSREKAKAGFLRLINFLGTFGVIDANGVVTMFDPIPTVTLTSPLTGATITGVPTVNETHYVTPAGTIAALTWNLPKASDARVGQTKTFCSNQIITALTVTALGGGVKAGAALAAAAQNVSYTFQCVSIVGSVATWLRLS